MNLKSPTLTRRTFLEGAGAAVAVTIAHAKFHTLLTDRPLEVATLLDGEASLAALRSVIASRALSLQAALATSVALRGKATKLLRQMSMPIVASGLSLRQTDLLQLPDALLIFGRWQDTEPTLLPALQHRLAIYVDDPALAMKLGKGRAVYSRPERTLAGLTSMMDPAVEHAEWRLRSGVMGDVSDLAVVIRNRDEISELEAAAALRQVSKDKLIPKARRMVTLNLQAGIHVTCARGQLHIPLYSAEERMKTLPFRLQHFALVARGEAIPAISLPEMVSLSEWM
jgi:hypothetical protein